MDFRIFAYGYMILIMAYVGVEFSQNDTIGLVHSSWFTPLKHEVFWPPYKTSSAFNKALTSAEEPDQSTWKLSHIKRKFFECDDIKKAHRKLKRCEMSSDIQSSDLENNNQIKRIRLNKKRWSSSSTDSEVESNHSLGNLNREKSTKFPRLSGLPQLTKPASLALPGSSFTNERSISKHVEPTEAAELSQVTNSLLISHTAAPPARTPVENASANISLEDIFKEVRKLREEIKEVKAILKQSRSLVTASIPSDIPVVLPLKDNVNFQMLEEYLNSKEKLNDLASYLASLGGTGTTGLVNRILRTILSNKLATGFNFAGQRSERSNKKAFGTTNLNLSIKFAVQIKFPAATQSEVENAIKIWLKHAKQRMQKTFVAPIQLHK